MTSTADNGRLLAIDVGNTRVKLGTFRRSADFLPEVDRITAVQIPSSAAENDCSTHSVLLERISDWLGEEVFSAIALAGSNASLRDQLLQNWPDSAIEVTLIDGNQHVPIVSDVDEPERVGIDRLLSCVAARKMVTDESPIIVVDSGTATTVNLVTQEGTFRGGAILPGLRLSARALHQYTDRLPAIDADQLFTNDEVDAPLPGRNTDDAIKSGLFWGQLGAIREICQALSFAAMASFGCTQPPVIVMTGGGGRQLHNEFPDAIFIDSLALRGLAIVGDSMTRA